MDNKKTSKQIVENLVTVPKVLTLWQPYATLFMLREKNLETRPSPTSYRGTYLIHSAKAMSKEMKQFCETEFVSEILQKHGIESWQDLECGKILGSYRHENCKLITDDFKFDLTYQELMLGDYENERWAWSGSDFRELNEPIEYTGGQGYYVRYKGDMKLIESLVHEEKNLFT